MPKKAAKKKAIKKTAGKKSVKKTLKKNAGKKKAAKKKTAKKKTAKKASPNKKPTKKSTKKSVAPKTKPASKPTVPVKTFEIEPGPATMITSPVEEPIQHEIAVGTVTHYYSHLNVAVVQLNTGTLDTGATIHIKGNTTDFTQKVESMEFEHQSIAQATAGQSFGLRVKEHAREHDIVYLVK